MTTGHRGGRQDEAVARDDWHGLPTGRVLELLDSSSEELTSGEAARRLAEGGGNDTMQPRDEGFLEELAESLR